MTTLQYEDSGCRKKQIIKERDEFAIGFAEWILRNGVYHQLIRTQKINKELLEIYKKEKGL